MRIANKDMALISLSQIQNNSDYKSRILVYQNFRFRNNCIGYVAGVTFFEKIFFQINNGILTSDIDECGHSLMSFTECA